MKRRDFLRKTGFATLFAGALPWRLRAEEAPATAAGNSLEFTTAPSLQHPTPTGVTIAIGVNALSTVWVEYGDTNALGQVAYGSRHGLKPVDALAHHIRIEGLKPGQRCFYRLHGCPIDFRNAYDIRRGPAIQTEVFSFRTLNPDAAETRFVVWNDTHENAALLAKLAALTPPLRPDFLVWNGDVPNDLYREDKLAGLYFSPGGQPFTREVPLIFVRGNHDTRGPAARALPRFIETPGGRFYYSFRSGPVAGIVLDGGEDKPDNSKVYAGLGDFDAYRREQTAWLAAELKRPEIQSAPFRIVFCHIPYASKRGGYAERADDPRSAWHPLFVEGKIAAVISGHTHRHDFLPPEQGRPYAQLIGGAPKAEAATLIRGEATQSELKLTMTNLDGGELAAFVARS